MQSPEPSGGPAIALQSALPIISTKLGPPRLVHGHLSRSRLRDRLNAQCDRPFLLISAPAGYGKSTLISEWLEQSDAPSGWLSLDDGDNDLGVFLTYVAAAIHETWPTARLDLRDLLRAPVLPPLDALAACLVNDLNQVDADFFLVLDDYHVITNPHVHDLLLHLLRHPPPQMHLIVATRVDPPWPLPGLRARGQMAELRFEDLQFTPEESSSYMRRALGDRIDADTIASLHERTEGWAAGLHLITLALDGHESAQRVVSRVAGAGHGIGEYLLTEVFSQQAPAVQDRLLRLSVLERFCGRLCEVLCDPDAAHGESNSWGKDFLHQIEQANLFLIPLDSRHEFFRFHHLFQQFLVERMHEHYAPQEIAELHRRASEWFAQRGLLEEALNHALAAGETAAAARLVAQHRHDLYNHEQFARLARLMRLLPHEALANNPELALAEARIATMNWRFTEAAVLLDRAERDLLHRSPDDPGLDHALGELAVLRGILDFWNGDATRLQAAAQFALNVLPPDASHLRGLCHTGIAASHFLSGNVHQAWTYLEEQLAAIAPRLPMYAWLLDTQAFLRWLTGDLTQLQVAATRLLGVSEDLDLPDMKAVAHYLLGSAAYARNELAAAERHLTAAVAARYNMRLMWWCQAAGTLALTYQALRRPADARQTLEAARDFLLERHAVRLLPNIGAFQAELDRLQDRLAEAGAWAGQVDPGPLVWAFAIVDPRLAQTRISLAQETASGRQQATQLLAQLGEFCARIPNRRLLMEVEVLQALLHDQRGEDQCALETLERVVNEAERDGWVRLFVDLGPRMGGLLSRLAGRGVAPHYVEHVLAAFPTRPVAAAPRAQSVLIEPLSTRELEILTLLAQRYSNKEIASHLCIAPSTVKRHTINIYRKLAAGDRREAVTRAGSLGLLEVS